jgi:hypothetical protein
MPSRPVVMLLRPAFAPVGLRARLARWKTTALAKFPKQIASRQIFCAISRKKSFDVACRSCAVGTLVKFSFFAEASHSLPSTQHSAWPVSNAGKTHRGFAFFKDQKEKLLSLAGSRQGHFLGFAFFTADFLAPLFALLFPLPMSALAAW